MAEHELVDVIDESELVADEERYLISDLCLELEPYLSEDEIKDVYRAYLYGAQAHEGQYRMSGEPYIYHPIAVARILAEMHVDSRTIIAAILHDVIEDTPSSKEQVRDEFGADVAELVDGVSKLSKLENKDKQQQQAENIQKMLLAMARDIRVIMIKLADRLHNMRTLGVMRPDKKRRIARETLEIYAPIAQRLGINTLRVELEDLGLQSLHPYRYAVLEQAIKKVSGHRKEVIEKLDNAIVNRMIELDIDGTVFARKKHLYSLYRKMKIKRLPFKKVFDVYALRIVVQTVDSCYRMLGVVHNLFKPIPGRFKDYIAIPKGNGYQSLHTALYGPHAIPMEVQIRTREMEEFAEAGIAAHWLYKSGKEDMHGHQGAQARARDWLTGVLEMQQQAGDPVEFLDNVKLDLFPDEIYVYTPDGDIIKLPKGSTPVDFAYAVHTGIGNTCVAAKLDHQFAPLNTPLYSGQSVEIITSPMARPNPVWLNYVVSVRARNSIRNYLKNLRSDEALAQGKRLMTRCLKVYNTTLEELDETNIKRVLDELEFESFDRLLEDVGMGNRPPSLVARRLLPDLHEDNDSGEAQSFQALTPLAISGTEGMVVSYAKCCYPIPNDEIVGLFNKGRGIVIHREGCKNITAIRHSSDSVVEVAWSEDISLEFSTRVCVEVTNQTGVLARLASAISEEEANIESVDIEDRDGIMSVINFTLSVKNRQHLARIMRRLRSIPALVKTWRMR